VWAFLEFKKPSSATGNMSQKIMKPTMETHLITHKRGNEKLSHKKIVRTFSSL
jgi:hypothetical protein